MSGTYGSWRPQGEGPPRGAPQRPGSMPRGVSSSNVPRRDSYRDDLVASRQRTYAEESNARYFEDAPSMPRRPDARGIVGSFVGPQGASYGGNTARSSASGGSTARMERELGMRGDRRAEMEAAARRSNRASPADLMSGRATVWNPQNVEDIDPMLDYFGGDVEQSGRVGPPRQASRKANWYETEESEGEDEADPLGGGGGGGMSRKQLDEYRQFQKFQEFQKKERKRRKRRKSSKRGGARGGGAGASTRGSARGGRMEGGGPPGERDGTLSEEERLASGVRKGRTRGYVEMRTMPEGWVGEDSEESVTESEEESGSDSDGAYEYYDDGAYSDGGSTARSEIDSYAHDLSGEGVKERTDWFEDTESSDPEFDRLRKRRAPGDGHESDLSAGGGGASADDAEFKAEKARVEEEVARRKEAEAAGDDVAEWERAPHNAAELEARQKEMEELEKEKKVKKYPWDYCMVFNLEPNETEKQRKRNLIRCRILNRLRSVELTLRCIKSRDDDEVLVLIRAPQERLEREAERNNVMMKTKRPPHHVKMNFHSEPFSRENKEEFLGAKDGGLFESAERQRLIYSIVRSRKEEGGAQVDVRKMKLKKVLSMFFPLHDEPARAWLLKNWALNWREDQPLNDVRDYFGEKIALYFSWLGFYRQWLFIPAVAAIFLLIFGIATGDYVDNAIVPFYALALAMWATLFMEFWKRRNSVLALRWAVHDFEEEESARPEYYGSPRVSPVTDELEIWYPSRKRAFKYVATTLGSILVLSVIVAAAIGIIFLRWYLRHHLGLNKPFDGILAGSANGMTILVLNTVSAKLAFKMTYWENHRTETEFEDALIAKTFLFQFVNNYAALFYIAFLKGRVSLFGSNDPCNGFIQAGSCMEDTMLQLASVFMSQMFVGQFNEVMMPYIMAKLKAKAETRKLMKEMGTKKVKKMTKPEKESKLPAYESTFADYNEMMIQFGFVTLFAAAFPLTAFFAYLNNTVEVRSDAFKLLNSFQRPHYMPAQDMGTWYYVLQIMSTVSVLTNVWIVGFTSDQLVTLASVSTNFERLMVVVIAENCILLIKFILGSLVPDSPKWCQHELDRITYLAQQREDENADKDEAANWDDEDVHDEQALYEVWLAEANNLARQAKEARAATHKTAH